MPSAVWDSVSPPSQRNEQASHAGKAASSTGPAVNPQSTMQHRPRIASGRPRNSGLPGADSDAKQARKEEIWGLSGGQSAGGAKGLFSGGPGGMVLLQSPANSAGRRPGHHALLSPKAGRKPAALTPSSSKNRSRPLSGKSSSPSAALRRFSPEPESQRLAENSSRQMLQRPQPLHPRQTLMRRVASDSSRPASSPSPQVQQMRKQEFLRELRRTDSPRVSTQQQQQQDWVSQGSPPGSGGSSPTRAELRLADKIRGANDGKSPYRSPANLASLPWRRDTEPAARTRSLTREPRTQKSSLQSNNRQHQPMSFRQAAEPDVGFASGSMQHSRTSKTEQSRRAGVARSPSRRAAASASTSIQRAAHRARTAGSSMQPSSRSGQWAAAGSRTKAGARTQKRGANQHTDTGVGTQQRGANQHTNGKASTLPGQPEEFKALAGPIAALIDKQAGYTTKLQAVHQMNGKFLSATTFLECEEMGGAAAQESVLKSMLSMVASGEPHCFMALNALHFAAFTEETCRMLVSLHALEMLLGLLRAASSLEPELAFSALSLLVTLVWSEPGCTQAGNSKAPVAIACWFLSQEQAGVRRLAHQLVQAHIQTPQGLRAACRSNKLIEKLEMHMGAEVIQNERALVRETINYIKLAQQHTMMG